jgi:hypothetical protein
MSKQVERNERLSVAELQALADSIYIEAWRNLPPGTLTTSEQEELLRYKWDIGASVEAGDPEAVRARAQAFADFLKARIAAWEQVCERRAAEVRQRTLSGIMVSRPGQPLAGPWPSVKPDLGGSHEA